MRTRLLRRFVPALAFSTVLLLAPAPAANALIHEIIGAACRAGGEEVVPPGQAGGSSGDSLVRALRATGVITSIDFSDPSQVVVSFDPTKPSSKYMSAGFDLTIPDGFGPGVDLVLSPLLVPDPEFAAHANCHNLNP
jgi:hypothetical protein